MAYEDIVKHQWPKGVSGNPKGYSRGRRQIDDLMDLIKEKQLDRRISEVWLEQILSGAFPHFKEFLERRDGKVPMPVEVSQDTSGNDFSIIIPETEPDASQDSQIDQPAG